MKWVYTVVLDKKQQYNCYFCLELVVEVLIAVTEQDKDIEQAQDEVAVKKKDYVVAVEVAWKGQVGSAGSTNLKKNSPVYKAQMDMLYQSAADYNVGADYRGETDTSNYEKEKGTLTLYFSYKHYQFHGSD